MFLPQTHGCCKSQSMAFNVFKRDDPMQLFEVQEKPCQLLTVTVLRGRNITQGSISDKFDTPDPYVVLAVTTSPEKEHQTRVIDDNPNAEWNESFNFHLDPREENVLDIYLKESDILLDDLLHKESIVLINIPSEQTQHMTLKIGEKTELDIKLHITNDVPCDLDYGIFLCEKETEFLTKRKAKIMAAMKAEWGEQGPITDLEVPVVGVLGSGGGFRAMIGYNGALAALEESGILDMTCYIAGLSGSSWTIANLYSNPKWPNSNAEALQEDFREGLRRHGVKTFLNHTWMTRATQCIQERKIRGQQTNIVDYYGHGIGERILRERMDCKLSDQQEKVDEANVPLPLYCCINVKNNVSAEIWHEWIEFSPYIIGMPKYGISMAPQLFGKRFFLGRCYERFPEEYLHYFIGLWASAFSILLSRAMFGLDKTVPVDEESEEEDDPRMENKPQDNTAEPVTQSDKGMSHEDEEQEYERQENNQQESQIVVFSQEMTDAAHSFWEGLLQKTAFFGSRYAQAAVIPNVFSGLSLGNRKPFARFDLTRSTFYSTFRGIFEAFSPQKPDMILVDAGLSINLPFPLLLRPQRGVDIILSFDFSKSKSDEKISFKHLKLAELWARKHKIPFPKINEKIIEREGPKECYIFKDKDPACPVVIHIILININFMKEKAPGIPRETEEELEFGKFSVWESRTYGTFKTRYSDKEFNQLRSLMKYNTLLYADKIKEEILERVAMKRHLLSKEQQTESSLSSMFSSLFKE